VAVLQHAVEKLAMPPGTTDDGRIAEQRTCNKPSAKVRIDRPVYTQEDFHETFQISLDGKKGKPFKKAVQSLWRRECYPPPSKECFKSSCLSFLPFIRVLAEYKVKRDLVGDVVAGLTIAFMHIPQGDSELQVSLPIIVS